ncbi:GL21586 [Drosophila persimilis]|uniref:GL21586 n=1 Tax=Drosophila persimilis TaxID=7234 RepID=B4GFQ1_DROPE|nr:GL21586 [Drosophila persimilis]
MLRQWACLLLLGSISIQAVPYYGDSGSGSESEFEESVGYASDSLSKSSFMPHLTHPLPLHRTMFAPIPLAPLEPLDLEPMHAQASQRVASVWARGPPGPMPLAPQRPQSHLLPLFSSGSSFDTEFVPLEQQQQPQGRQDVGPAPGPVPPTTGVEQKPFNVDAITTDVNAPNPAIFLQQSFPFFGNEFFNSFGGFGFGNAQEPWWKGPNVCTEKEEGETVATETEGDETVDTFGPGT